MPAQRSYLEDRRHERRWRVITGLVVAGAMAAAALWTLGRYAHAADATLVSSAGTPASPPGASAVPRLR